MMRGTLVAIAVGAVAAAGVVLLGHTERGQGAAPRTPLSVEASITPASFQLGDRLTARVIVLLDRRAVRRDTLRVVDDLAPLSRLGEPKSMRARRGRLDVVTFETPAACLSEACIARTISLPAVRVAVERRSGGVLRARSAWPSLDVVGRVSAAALARSRPPFRGDTTPPPPSYRISPSTLAVLLDVLAVALVAAAAALLLVRRRRRAAPAQDDLERALHLAREAEARSAPDRRRALGLLARLLGDRDRSLAGTANDLAWSEPQPEPRAVGRLVDDVESELRS
jgi:hypothetical protein